MHDMTLIDYAAVLAVIFGLIYLFNLIPKSDRT